MKPFIAWILQAWGILEAEDGDLEKARELLQLSTEADPQHVHAWHAWAMLELRSGNLQRARELFQSAVWCQTTQKDFCTVWQVRAAFAAPDGATGCVRLKLCASIDSYNWKIACLRRRPGQFWSTPTATMSWHAECVAVQSKQTLPLSKLGR